MSIIPFAIAVDLDATGAHPASGRAAAHPADALSGRRIAAAAQTAERFGFSAATFHDEAVPASPRLDAVQRAAYVAARTTTIGVLPVVDVAYSEPFHVATQLASLDWLSRGRAGWIVASSGTAREAAAFGRAALDDAGRRRERDDAVEVARRLWDSWEDDAVIRDVATGRYLDRDKLHYVDFEGASYSIKGPLITPRPPQGQLVVAGSADTEGVDIAIVDGADVDEVSRRARDARTTAALVWAEIEVVLDARGVPATRRLERLDADEPWHPTGRLRHVGDAPSLAALIATLARDVDGVRLRPAVLDVDLEQLGRGVLPVLRQSIGFRSPHAGATLRSSLGLPHPVNRYTAAREFA